MPDNDNSQKEKPEVENPKPESDDVMRIPYTPPQGNAVEQVKEAITEATGQPADLVDDVEEARRRSTLMEQEAADEATHLAPRHVTKLPEQRIEFE